MPSTNGRTRVASGLHSVRSRRAGKPDRWYVYAWRGGPCIHTQDGARPVITRDLLDRASAIMRADRAGGEHTFDAEITAYRNSPAFTLLASSTQLDYRLWLDRISTEFGAIPLAAFADSQMRGEILDWRDRWVHQPRTADKAAGMMGTLLGWIVDRGRLPVNVAAGIQHLHKVDKSDEVWERRHMRAATRFPRHIRHALMLAGLTGLRMGDLVALDWSQVGRNKIVVDETQKRGGRAVIPILPETRRLLHKIGGEKLPKAGPVLTNSRGKAWTVSLGNSVRKLQPDWFDRTIHDLRGTFATRLILAGLTDDEAAMVMGWTAKRIAAIRARYVNEERVVIQLAERLSA